MYIINFFRFLRLKVSVNDQMPLWSSNHRHAVLSTLPRCESISGVVAVLGDQTDLMYSFFRDGGGKDQSRTIVIGTVLVILKNQNIFRYRATGCSLVGMMWGRGGFLKSLQCRRL